MKNTLFALFTLCASLAPLSHGFAADLEEEYQRVVAQHGKMSEAANNLRERIIDDHWEAKEFDEIVPYARDSWAWYQQQGVTGPRLNKMRYRLGKSLRVAGYVDEAAPILREAYEAFKKNKGEESKQAVLAGTDLGFALSKLGKNDEAVPLLEKQVKLAETYVCDACGVTAFTHLAVAWAYTGVGRYQEADKSINTAIEIYRTKRGESDRVTNASRMIAGRLYRNMGRFEDSEKILRAAYANYSSKPENQSQQLTSSIIGHLGQTLMKQGRFNEAEELLKRAVSIKEKAIGANSTNTFQSMLTLAQLYLEMKRNAEAEALTSEVIQRMQGVVEENASVRARANALFARAKLRAGKLDEAEQAYNKVKSYLDKSPDEVNLRKAYLTGLGSVQLERQKYAEAKNYLQQALELTVRINGDYTPDTARVRNKLARAEAGLGNYEQAITTFRSAMAASSGFLAQRETFSKTGRAQQEAAVQEYLRGFMNLMVDAHLSNQKLSANPVAESFTIAENSRGQSLQTAMLGMAARAAARNEFLSELVRKEQDLRLRLGQLDDELLELVKQGDSANLAQIPRLEERRKEMISVLKTIGEQMGREYPEYNRLINPPATQVSDVQSQLATDELLLSYYVQPERTLIWVVTRDSAQLHVYKEGSNTLQQKVKQLRGSLDVPVASLADVPPYDLKLANEFYQALIAPAGAHLQKARHLIVVPHGPLYGVPFGALVSKPTQLGKATLPFAEYRNVPWLAAQYSMSVVPSATAIVTMRKYAKREQPSKPFIGFGDPLFGETITSAAVTTRGVPMTQRAVINTRSVRSLPNLPETRDEVQKIALTLGASSDSVYLGQAANEANVKKADLKDYKVVAFATHGLVAGDLDGLEQPALALTPPETGTKENDGLLQMGEVLALDLNADWVVLSACNTAAGDKAVANEGLTGLTQAFFYAGSRALLVSLWPVESTSTQILTTTMFNAARENPQLGRAESLQVARKRLIDGPGYQYEGKEAFSYAHPIFWSAFIAVGEGGVN